MKESRFLSYIAALALAGTLTLSGCNKNTGQQATNQPTSTPGAQSSQPATEKPPAGQPAPGGTSAPPASNATPESSAAPALNAAQQAPAPPPPPAVVEIPAGTQLRVRLDQDLGSKINQPGDSFSATLADPVVVNGVTVIPRGARAEGTVIDAKPLGRFKGGALLQVKLERVRTNRGSYPVSTSTIEKVQAGKGKRSAGFIGGGGGFGALIGGIAGGGKGALIGGITGAGAGTAGTALTGNKQIVLPVETLLIFRLERPVRMTQ